MKKAAANKTNILDSYKDYLNQVINGIFQKVNQ